MAPGYSCPATTTAPPGPQHHGHRQREQRNREKRLDQVRGGISVGIREEHRHHRDAELLGGRQEKRRFDEPFRAGRRHEEVHHPRVQVDEQRVAGGGGDALDLAVQEAVDPGLLLVDEGHTAGPGGGHRGTQCEGSRGDTSVHLTPREENRAIRSP